MLRAFLLNLIGLAFLSGVGHAAVPEDIYYDQLFADGALDITIFLGFEQQKSSIRTPVIKDVADVFKGPHRDQSNTLRDVNGISAALTGCFGCNLRPAGEGTGFRYFVGEFLYKGRTIRSRVKLLFSENGVKMSALRDAFIAALGHDDVIVYLGHSRNGRGFPDFGSPVSDTGKVYYEDQVSGWLGFERGYFNPNKYQLLVLNACQTERYYKNVLRTHLWEKDPSKLGMIMSTDDTWFEDYPDTSAALLYGLITQAPRQTMLDTLDESATTYHSLHLLDAEKRKLFMGDGFFDTTYAGQRPPERIEPNEPWRDMPF